MASKSDVPLHGASVNIVRQCGTELKDVIQSKFGCKVEIHGVDFERDASLGQWRKPTIVPEERFSVQLNGVKVSVWKADLTNFKVDAVVNAANKNLHHAGGLAKALCDAGGAEIQRESDKHISKYGALKTGEAIVTNAGNLKCRMLIHAVGPDLLMNPTSNMVNQAKPLLSKAVRSILAVAEKQKLHSVAIPALSSGLFNFPLRMCADTIVTALKDYLPYLPCDILLVNNDEPSVSEMERACRQITNSPPPSYSQAARGGGRGAAKTSEFTVDIGNVRLTLTKGSIEEQNAHVIVNTISPNLDLSQGQISNALLRKAGRGMQDEIRQPKKHPTRHVIATKPHKLNCKEVYHTLCSSSVQDKLQILYDAIQECLNLAASNQHRSIAFPAIGTGNLGFDKTVAAQIITKAVDNFTQHNPHRMEIYFVIHPSADDTFKAFEAQMKSLPERTSRRSPSHGSEHNMDFNDSRASTPLISLSGTLTEEADEARQWLRDLFNSSGIFTVRNNFIQYFGEQEFHQLSRKVKPSVRIEEFFNKGCAGVIIEGASAEDVAVLGVQLEAMLCRVQEEFVNEEERSMPQMSTTMSTRRKPVAHSSSEFSDRERLFKRDGLQIIRIDKVENPALEKLFELKKKQLRSPGSPQKMYQRIPAQFCQMVSHIGFHREYAPPDDAKYGEGIYFTGSLTEAQDVWRDMAKDEYQYFVEAQVLTGISTTGQPGLIVPPPVGKDPVILFDSLSGGSRISVIFSGHQALPSYIIICKKKY